MSDIRNYMGRKTIAFDFNKIPNPTIEDIRDYLIKEYIDKGFNFKKFNLSEPIIWSIILANTEYLGNVKTKQRIATIIHGHPDCKMCGNKVRWDHDKYGIYCSTICRNSDLDYKTKIKLSKKEHFGDNYNKVISDKRKTTMLNKYGSTSYIETEEFKKKSFQTHMDKYGVDNFAKTDEYKILTKTHFNETYGVDSYTQTDEFKQKYKKTSLDKYGTYHPMQSSIVKDKVTNSTFNRFGVKYYQQVNISNESLELLNDKNWLIEKHHNNKRSLQHIAELLNVDDTTVKRYIDKHGIEQRFYGKSDEQIELEDYISSLGVSIESNNRTLISPLELDILIPEYNIAIEYCGLYWHSELHKNNNYHHTKMLKCNNMGYRLITIFQNEWENNKDLVKKKLAHILGKTLDNKIYARKTKIVEVNAKDKTVFFDKHHIQGNGPSSINYGLEYNNELVACIGFIKNNDGSYNLNRYATSCNVVGGFTKLLSYFEKVYNKPKIITFADLRWSQGDLYYRNGFIMDKELKPDYFWVKGMNVYHKFNFRHTTGLKKLENYDPNLSESENMHNHGYYRIYDCGKLRFVK